MQKSSMDPRTALREYAEALKIYIEAPIGKQQEDANEDLVLTLGQLEDQGYDMIRLIEDLLSESDG